MGSAASSRLRSSGGGSSVVSGGGTLAGGGLSGSTALVQAANLGGSGRALGGTELLDVGLAGVLAILVAGVGLDAVGEELLADEGGQGLGVVLETGSRAVGSARAVVRQSSLVTIILIGVVVAKNLAGVGLSLAPHGSLLLGNSVGVNGHVERALVGRDLGRHHSSGNGNEDGGGSHFEGGLADKGIKLKDIEKKGTKTANEQLQERGARGDGFRRRQGYYADAECRCG